MRFQAQNARGIKAGPISVTIKQLLTLPTADAEQLALTKLLLSEAPSPFLDNYDASKSKAGM